MRRIVCQADQWPLRCAASLRVSSRRQAAVNQDLVDRLKGEFGEWHRQQPRGSIFGGGMIGGLNEWPNIERFLKDKYPAAHQGFDSGYEQARTLLDWDKMYPDEEPGGHERYQTGPEAVAQHGYDPAEIAAGMLLLHNKTDRFRGDLSQEDQRRLNDIFTKREKMQQNYEQKQAGLLGWATNILHQAAKLPTEEELSGLQHEFDQWWGGIPEDKRRQPDGGDNWTFNTHPITSWRNVEDFLAQHHPKAYSGGEYGEDAEAVLKPHPEFTYPPRRPKDTRTLADMLMLHRRNQAEDFSPADEQILYNSPGVAEAIVKGRNKMQQDYEQKEVR